MTRQQLDQALAATRDTLPRLWWAIYQGSIDAGFTADQAFLLVQSYMASQALVGYRPPDKGQPSEVQPCL